ncbi:MAG: SusC/RagA family TonB-linked outer membrane protein [Coprobacter sp.]|nr:SusC/RagA family TonB-linked outer membrane protein [Coprobacter sp.]
MRMDKIKRFISSSLLVGGVGLMFWGVPASAYAQTESDTKTQKEEVALVVKGVAIDAATGETLVGVRIGVVNARVSAMTDENGAFTLNAPHTGVTLLVEAAGYQSQIVPLRGAESITLKLSPVTGRSFYDDDLLKSTGEDVASQFDMGTNTADEAISFMHGDVYTMSRSGFPGSGAAVFVNGIHSINASAQPLYVVDGVVWSMNEEGYSLFDGHYNNPLALIDPQDIEDISVLKNGTAIYGAKGGNGVVLITTKRAKSAATEIEAYARVGFNTPGKSIPVMDASQYRLYVSDILSGAYKNSSYVDRYNFLNDDPTRMQYKATHNNTDWLDLTTRTALLMNYGINVRGGDERALYSFSLAYTKNESTMEESDFNRLNIRFNSDIYLWKNFDLRFDVAFSQVSQHLFNDGINDISSPYYLSLIKSPLYHPNVISNKGEVTLKYSDVDELGVGNPMAIYDLGRGDNKNYRFNLNAAPEYRITSQFKMKGLIGFAFDKLKENSFLPDYGLAETPLLNSNNEIYATSRNVVTALMDRRITLDADIHGEYTPLKDIKNDLVLQLGYRFRSDSYTSTYGEGHNTSSDYMNALSNTTSSLKFSDGVTNNWKNMAWYLTAEYAFMKRYMLDFNIAMETSSRFGKNADNALKMCGVAWGLFPSVNAAWIVSSEEWMKNATFINFMKIRAGYDVAGNDALLPDYATRTYFTSVSMMNNAFGLALANIGNDKLKWETTATARVGLDMSMFNNRWNLNFDYYFAKTKDLLVQKQLNDVAGLSYFWTNAGDMENRGFNLATSVRAVNYNDWKLDVGFSIGKYKNEVTSLADGDFTTDVCGGTVLTSVGNAVGVFYGYKTSGVFSTSEEAAASGLAIRNDDGSLTAFGAGDMRFEEVEKNGIIDEKDMQIIGDPTPDFYGNINLALTWKNLTIGALFTYSVGNDAYNALRANLESGSDVYNQSTSLQNRWVANGQVTDIPRATYGDPMGNSRFSDRWIEDASYLKWKSLSVSYNLPVGLRYLQGVTFSFSVNNLCTWSQYLGSDPEFSMSNSPLYLGVDGGLTPLGREFNFGVKINL